MNRGPDHFPLNDFLAVSVLVGEDIMLADEMPEMADAVTKGLKDRTALIDALRKHVVVKETAKIEGHLSGKSFCVAHKATADAPAREHSRLISPRWSSSEVK